MDANGMCSRSGVDPSAGTSLGSTGARQIKVFVHLSMHHDAHEWQRRKARGSLVGLSDDTPYGYGRAESMGCRVVFSRARGEDVIGKISRLALRVLLGFDFLHAWRQRSDFVDADIIWTHTESQYLAVAAVLALTGAKARLLGQTVWLMDRWQSLWLPYRWLYRRLIDKVDVLTFHSPDNLSVARALFPRADIRLVRYGIPSEKMLEPRPRSASPVRVLALGNDRHRDWRTLIEAVKSCREVSALVLSGSVSPSIARGLANVDIRPARTNDELRQAFQEATVVCVPLQPNLHASGLTVIQEAVLFGVPVVATDTGGLSAYFSNDEVCFVPPNDPSALREALLRTALCPQLSCERARRAQARMGGREPIGAEAYIRAHVEISRELLRA